MKKFDGGFGFGTGSEFGFGGSEMDLGDLVQLMTHFVEMRCFGLERLSNHPETNRVASELKEKNIGGYKKEK